MKIFNEILDKHTKMYNCKRESYMINDDLEILISQDGNKVALQRSLKNLWMDLSR